MNHERNEIEVKNINDYIMEIIRYAKKFDTVLWYRGHRSCTWKLHPSLFRSKVLDIPNDGRITEKKYKNFIDFNEAINEFRKQGVEIENNEYNLFHYTFLAQHYGMPTPFLDWSTDPLVALYFAVNEFTYSDTEEYPVVYILNPVELNKNSQLVLVDDKGNKTDIDYVLSVDELDDRYFEKWYSNMNATPFGTIPVAVKSDHDLKSHRISRQSGVFTLHEAREIKSPGWYDRIGTRKIIKISPTHVCKIKEQLSLMNITKETIYGTEENIFESKIKDIVAKVKKL